jgi:hypothetical protein
VTRVPPKLRAAVMERDKRCVLFDLDPSHVCKDQWGQSHMPGATHLLTIEHVKRQLRAGVRAENEMGCMVAMCWSGNLRPPTKLQRAALRSYLEAVS